MNPDDYDGPEVSNPKLHRKPLTQREVFELFAREPRVRPLLLAALGGLAMIFLVTFLGGSDIGALVVALFGLAALAFRWPAGPPLIVLMLIYFQLFPYGLPPLGYDNVRQVPETHFRMADVLLVMAVLVYFRSFYRLLGVVHQSMPSENLFRPRGEYPARRPAAHVEPDEVMWLIAAAGALAIFGQVAWWVVNSLDFTPGGEGPLVRWADPDSLTRYGRVLREPGEFSAGESRFFVTVGAVFFGFLLLRLVFGYWRLRTMNAAEGAMVLTDTSWAESHRERLRVEKWRIWGRRKYKEAARREREKRQKVDG